MCNQLVLGSETGNRRRLGFWASNSLSRELGGKRVIVAIKVQNDDFELRADSTDRERVRAGLIIHSDDEGLSAALASPGAPVVASSSKLSDGHRAMLCCISREHDGKVRPFGIVGVCFDGDDNEEAFISKALVEASQILAGLYITTTIRCEFTHQFCPQVFNYLKSRYAFPNGIALGYFTEGANIVIAAVSDGSPGHLNVGHMIEDRGSLVVTLQSMSIDGNDNVKAILLIAKSDIDALTLQHAAELSGPWQTVKSAVSASAAAMKELQLEINGGFLNAIPLFPVTQRPSFPAVGSYFITALQQNALSLIASHVSDEKVRSCQSLVFRANIPPQLDSILATDEPSPFLLQLMQGVATALGGESGDWNALKASLKVVFPSIHTSTGPPSSVPLISINSEEDDGTNASKLIVLWLRKLT
jgi:hypothetical protein